MPGMGRARVPSYWLASFVLLTSLVTSNAWAGETDPQAVWPLCGRISASPPAGWTPQQGCPADRFGNPAFTDAPFSSTFGPRPLYSGDNRYDFHRGIDLATPVGTPVFAITAGRVEIAGNDPSFSDPVIKLRHFRPGRTSCSVVGCYYSLYLHMQSWAVAPGQDIAKGQLIGYTGTSASGFQHLHFEVRDAPASDPLSAWQRDAVHPMTVLPYSVPNNTSVSIDAVNAADPAATRATVTVTGNRYDLTEVRLRLFDSRLVEIPQPGNTPDARGYHVLPSFFNFVTANFQYSHKNSSSFPWSSYGVGGVNQCPYATDHGTTYEANVHLDRQLPTNYLQGQFNGVRTVTKGYWPSEVSNYWVQMEFGALKGPAACIEATATYAKGVSQSARWGQCTPPPAITIALSINRTRTAITVKWTGASGNTVDIRRQGVVTASPKNSGSWSDKAFTRGVSYTYQVCNRGSTSACSPQASIVP